MQEYDKSAPQFRAESNRRGTAQHHLVGGGIASLAAAVFLIRDAGVPGSCINIYEQSDVFGGSLDGSGSPATGYVVRGGRMFEPNFVCTFDLLSSIPSREVPGRSVKDSIETFNAEVVGYSHCRLVRDGQRVDSPPLELGLRGGFDLVRLMMRPEGSLAGMTIRECFKEDFFRSNFWFMWSSMFAFAPWHSAVEFRRYLRRFIHLFPGIKTLEGVLRTRFNQYDDLILPILSWLRRHDVRFHARSRVADLDLEESEGLRRVTALHLLRDGREEVHRLAGADFVYLTLGSMTEGTSLGATSAPPAPSPKDGGGAWALWRRLAARDPVFGRPEAFCGDAGRSQWESFTVTLCRPDFFEFMQDFTGNLAGTGGLVTFPDSNWLLSLVLFHQPHFRDQPEDVQVFWGNGLFPDRPGNFVAKPMAACSGQEILQEVAGHIGLKGSAERLLGGATCIPCMLPYITSQFMPRWPGDRPPVIPPGTANLAVIGQFCEIPEDTVFTVEYSVRSAMMAVFSLHEVARPVPPVRRTNRDPLVLFRALKTLVQG